MEHLKIYSVEEFEVIYKDKRFLYKLVLSESSCSQYGNNTAVGMYRDGKFVEGFDTRYDNRVKDFKSFSLELLKDYLSDECIINRKQ